MPPGFPRVNGVRFQQKIIQLPNAIVIFYETRTTFRQIFFDSNHTLTTDPQPTWMGFRKDAGTVTQAFQLMADGELIEYICNENNLAPPHLVGK